MSNLTCLLSAVAELPMLHEKAVQKIESIWFWSVCTLLVNQRQEPRPGVVQACRWQQPFSSGWWIVKVRVHLITLIPSLLGDALVMMIPAWQLSLHFTTVTIGQVARSPQRDAALGVSSAPHCWANGDASWTDRRETCLVVLLAVAVFLTQFFCKIKATFWKHAIRL